MSSDAQLAVAMANNPGQGLGPVYSVYAAKLYTYALTMLHDPAAAQDAVHDAFLAATGSIGQLRDPEKLRPWLYAITRNECLRKLRGDSRFSHEDETIVVADDSIDLDAGLRQEEAARLIAQGMAAMNASDRDLLTLGLQNDLDVQQMSKVTGVAVNTLHARMSRARSGLSDAISALMLYRTRGRECPELAAILTPANQPLTPLLRKRIMRHVKDCDVCERRRAAALVALGPAMAAPMFLEPPAELRARVLADLPQSPQFAERAAPFDPDGFPVPLDRQLRQKWLLPAIAGGVALIVIGLVLAVLTGRDQPTAAPSASPSPTYVSPSAFPSPAITTVDPSATPSPTATQTKPPTPRPTPTPTPTPRPTRTPTPTPTKTTTKTPTPTPTKTKTPTPTPTKTKTPTPTPTPKAPTITSAAMKDLDLADDGSFTRCDAFRLQITASVTGTVDTVRAKISPADTTVKMAGDPFEATTELAVGEYEVTVEAKGPGGTTTKNLGKITHICPG